MPAETETNDEEGDAPTVVVLAPWPIFTVAIERLGDSAEAPDQVYFHAGGQGFWVARMAANLGAEATLVGPFGGETGRLITLLAEDEGVGVRAVPVNGANGGYVHDRREGERRSVADMPAASLDRHEVDDLFNAALAEGLKAGVFVVTGHYQTDLLPLHFYKRLVHDLAANGVTVVADVSGDVLGAIEDGLSILKISHDELKGAGLAASDARDDLLAGIDALKDKAKDVVVSLAGAGTLARIGGRIFFAKSPELDALDHTGAGDSMTAALAVARATGLGPEETLRLAVATGAINVTRHGRGTGAREDIEALAERVEIEEIGT